MVFIERTTKTAIVATLLCFFTTSQAAVLLEDTKLVAATPTLAQVAPQARTFDVASAGRYAVTFSDLGFPAALTSIDLVITRGVTVIARQTQMGTVEFDASPGTYTVRVLGSGTSPGSVAVSVAPVAGGTPLLQFSAGIAASTATMPSAQSLFTEQFTVTDAGSYQIVLTDRAFPAALSTVDVLIADSGGAEVTRLCVPANPPCDSTATFTAAAGTYDVLIGASAAGSTQAGLFSLKVSGGPSTATLYSATHTVGILKSLADVMLPTSTQYSLTLSDLQFPAPLISIKALIAQEGEQLLDITASGTNSFTAAAGSASLYVWGTASAGSSVGTYGVALKQGSQSLFADVRAITAASSNVRAYVFSKDIAASGSYRVRLKDFGFPSNIASLQMLVAQNGSSLASLATAGEVSPTLNVGPVTILVLTNTASSATTGLFGVGIDALPAGTTLFDATQGVGDLFQTRTLSVVAGGNLDIALSDAGFPVAFGDLALAVTRGTSLVGQIFGGGKFTFAATPGDYSLNFIARSGGTSGYGLYGTKVEDTPPVPTVSLGAAPTAVRSQGTATLTWSSTDATSCSASGGWSGTRATSGSATVGPLSTGTTFTLACTGPGGTNSANVTVNIATIANDTGGGGIDLLWLGALASLLTISLKRSRRR